MRNEYLINDGWEFALMPFGSTPEEAAAAGSFEKVMLPHDWLIYNTLDLYADGSGFYRRTVNVSEPAGRRFLINFDGVYMDSTVYVNGKKAGDHRYGYSAFEFDVTELLNSGDNEILVEVRHKSPNTRWYSGAGIFRDVTWKEVPEIHIMTDGVYIHAQKAEHGRWKVTADVEISGRALSEKEAGGLALSEKEMAAAGLELTMDISLRMPLPENTGTISKPCAEAEGFVIESASHGDNCAICEHPCESRGAVRVSGLEQRGSHFEFCIDNPFVWDITSPNLYELTAVLKADGTAVDSMSTQFGLRSTEYDPERGFILNGRRVKLYGVCEHHDLGCLGAAFNKTAMRRKIQILKSMGVNAIRTSHNMPARGLMELADEMGILIDSEAFDMWRRSKTEFDYARFFDECCHGDITGWVRRDRNHPSVILWSIGNEIYDCHADESAIELTSRLRGYVEENDYMHNAPVTHGSNYMPWEGAQKCTDRLKIAGYNYGDRLYGEHHLAHPDWVIYGSETSSTVQSRGIYHFPYSVSVLADDDEQCSTLGNCTTSWGAPCSEYVIRADRDHEFSMGQFLWSGFDYIGEPTPYHTKNSYFGQIDTAGFYKDTYYIYKAEWTDVRKAPFVHVFPYWDFNEGQIIDVRACTNGAAVELFVNGRSLGKRSIDHEHGEVLVPTWQTEYHRGYIEAVAYDENGNEIARDRQASFGDAARLCVREFKGEAFGSDAELYVCAGDSREISAGTAAVEGCSCVVRAEGRDVIFLEITAKDREGHEVANASTRVSVAVEGGRLLGLDNGDSTDFEQYKCDCRRLFSGKLLAVIGPDSPEAEVRVRVTADKEIPVRKIELRAEGGTLSFDREHPCIRVCADIRPADASFNELKWEAVNDSAVGSNLAKLEPDTEGRTCLVTALGDGCFRLRCTCNNGTDTVRVISVKECSISGIGQAYLDPYEFIAGSLYTDSRGDVGNGNEKGVATARETGSYIGYENIDFGGFGSDTITMPIFTLDDRSYEIGIWEGRPGEEGSTLLLNAVYQKPSVWNVYQPETYRLSKRLKGVTSVYFTAKEKFHIKGFFFERPDRAFARIGAAEADNIYGDTYTMESDAVTGIGNNVTFEFGGLDFGERTAPHLIVCGHSPIANNSLHLKVTAADGSVTATLLEFAYSEGFEERSFEIPPITGSVRAAFVFLPGCNFDFKYFRFCKE